MTISNLNSNDFRKMDFCYKKWLSSPQCSANTPYKQTNSRA